jgi:hypothetical protein
LGPYWHDITAGKLAKSILALSMFGSLSLLEGLEGVEEERYKAEGEQTE